LASWVGEDGRPHFIVPFPTPGWRIEVFSMVLPQLLGSFLLMSLLYSLNRMITGVVHEREARLRDGMRMMGMHPAAFYASWVLTYVGLYMFVVLGITLMLSWGRILPLSSPSLLFVWLMLFSVAAIAYALVISTFFSKAKTAATVGSIVFFSSSYLRHLAQPDTSPRILRLLSLLPPVCFELASDVYGSLESQQVGITWANAGVPFNNFSVQESCWMLALDAVLLFLLFLYLDQVMPREIGLQRKWYFPLLPSFWAELCGSLKSRGQGDGQSSRLQQAQEPGRAEIAALIEPDLGEAAAWMSRNGQTVELRQLSKHFGALRAVEALDLVMYQGEIFALLGHNGAGKTTTLAVLCGLMAPSSGSCSIFGHDGGEDAAEVQRLLGVCPQHDVLWEELTCEEHMTLFAGFKGVPHADVAGEVSSMLQRVGLHRAGTAALQAGRLSGGMKRKLSLGIAFLGGSRLVVLDEPTSGLDPYSRRTVWELLRAMKQGRVTVLSTHYMDEADILGDRIAILHEGRLRCCGSPQFLKRAYDCGYNVSFVKRAGCSSEAVHEAVCRHVPELTSEVTTLSDSGKELILQFPFAAARHFPKVLGELEQQMEELLLESYGISVTTLEEVFLKVASGDVVERTATDAGSVSGSESISGGGEYVELAEVTGRGAESAREVRLLGPLTGLPGQQEQPAEEKPPGCCRRPVNQMRALIRKRWRYGLRDKRAFLCQMLLPTTTLVLFLAIMSVKLFSRMPPLELSASGFNEHCVDPLRGDGVQNVVDFTYLPFMGSEEAQAVLEPGKPFWKGDLRRCDPNEAINEADANEEVEQLAESEKALDETLATVAPGLLRNIMKPAVQQALISKVFSPAGLLAQSVRGGGGRRLEQLQGSEEISEVSEMLLASFEKQLLHMSVALWARATRLRQGAEALAELAAPGPGGRQWLDPILRQQVEPGPDLLSEQEPDPDVAEPRRLSLRRLQQQQHQQYQQQQQQHQQQQRQQQQRLLQGVGEETTGIDDTMPPAVGPPPTTNNNKYTMAVQEENNKYNDDKNYYNYHYNSSVRPVRFMGRKGVGFCPGAGSVERMIWSALELDTKGKLTREDLRETLEKLKLSVGGKAMDAKLHSQAGIQKLLASEKLKELLPELQESGLLAPNVSSEDQLGELFGDAVFLALDQNQDGVIDEAELCAVGKAVRTEVGRYLRLARQFSKQILTGASKCSRYGAYYVIAPARTADTADWVAGAEAVVFVRPTAVEFRGGGALGGEWKMLSPPSLREAGAAPLHAGGRAADLLWSLRRQAVQPSALNFAAAVAEVAKTGRWEAALQLLGVGRRWGLLGVPGGSSRLRTQRISYGAGISACARGMRWSWSLQLLQQLRFDSQEDSPDKGAFGAALGACRGAGAWEQTLAILASMAVERVDLDASAFGTALGVLCDDPGALAVDWETAKWPLCLQLLQVALRSPLLPAATALSTSVHALARARDASRACQVLHLLRRSSAAAASDDTILLVTASGAVLHALASKGHWRGSLALLQLMRRSRSVPSIIACNSAIDGCATGQQWPWALTLLLSSLPCGEDAADEPLGWPNEVSFGAALKSCAASGQWAAALQLLRLARCRRLGSAAAASCAVASCAEAAKWSAALGLLCAL
ncbi:unnamed protein product, partial [Polarella glacialis]